jgi:hypothetical protein
MKAQGAIEMPKRKEKSSSAPKRLVFGEGLMSPSLDGSKRFTVRKYREGAHDFAKGEIIIGEFKDGLDILLRVLEDTKMGSFKRLLSPEKDVGRKGYWFDEAYFDDLKAYYPDLTWETSGAVIIFEVLKVDGVSVVSINAHAK